MTFKEIAYAWSKLENSNFTFDEVLERLIQSLWMGYFGETLVISLKSENSEIKNIPDSAKIKIKNIFDLRKSFSCGNFEDIETIENASKCKLATYRDLWGEDKDTYLKAYLYEIILIKTQFIDGITQSNIRLPECWQKDH
ncbi:MAG: hypothetical protein P9L94_04300 [Candidatus Hinthialibacter antarcticus]|nr:hypothetical protein [Candidatus Hinthialibacter antarcticus]